MAGAGFKDFVAGDVLTADQVDTYLMQQSVMRFADASARDTALSGVLAEGMFAYLDDTDAVTVYTGSAWRVLWSDWISFTPSWTNMTTSSDTASYRYSPGRIQITGRGTLSAVLTGSPTLTLPNSHTIATEAQSTWQPFTGWVFWRDVDANLTYYSHAAYSSTTTITFYVPNNSGTYDYANNVGASIPFVAVSGDLFWYDLSIPYND